MNITIVTGPCFPVPAIRGGAMSRVWQGLAEAFAAKGHDVTIVSASTPEQPAQEKRAGVCYYRVKGFQQSTSLIRDLVLDFFYAWRTSKKLMESDILILNDFWMPCLTPYLSNHHKKIVLNANRFPKHQYFLYSKVDFIAAASEAVKEAIEMQNKGNKNLKSRIKVLPNPIDTRIFSPLLEQNEKRERKERKRKHILYVGRLHPEKGVHLLIDAFKKVLEQREEVQLKIVGPWREEEGGGGKDYYQKLQEKVADKKNKKYEERIIFEEAVYEPLRLRDLYREADIFCYPSLAEKGEALPLAPLEAMACEAVPVVSNLHCFKDYIIEKETGFFFGHSKKNRVENLTNTLLKALRKKDLEMMRRQVRSEAENYDFVKVAGQYLIEFEKLLAPIP